MEYVSKGFRFDEEVMAWLDKLKKMHGSYNKGLRLVAFPSEGRGIPPIETDGRAVKIDRLTLPMNGATKKLSKKARMIAERAAGDVIAQRTGRDDIDYSDVDSTPTTHVANLDATTPPAPAGRGKISMETWRANRKPLLKHKERPK